MNSPVSVYYERTMNRAVAGAQAPQPATRIRCVSGARRARTLRFSKERAALAIREQPGVDAVVGVFPHDVADAVVVEIADADRDRSDAGVRTDIDAARPVTV